jgi:hypothetical protein
MPTLAFRVRVRNETDSADLVTWTMDDLADAPRGDGTEVNIATGQVRSGSYTVRLADRLITGTERTGTRWLADAGGRNRLLSRRAFVERSVDGGAWLVMIPGYITRVGFPDAATVDVQIGESLRVPSTARAFTVATASSVRAAILGGSLTGPWGPLLASVGWTMRVVTVGGLIDARLVTMVPTVGAVPPAFTVGPVSRAMQERVNALAFDAVAARGAPYAEEVYTNQTQNAWRVSALSAALTPIAGGTVITAVPVVTDLGTTYQSQPALIRFGENGTSVGFSVDWPAGATLPSVSDTYTVRVTYVQPSPSSPIYYDAHPLTIASELYTAAGVAIDAASFAAATDEIGASLRLALRVTAASPLQSWLESNIAGPLGVTFLPDTAGRIAARLVRRTLSALPAATLTLDDIAAVGKVWDLEEGSAVARIVWSQRQFLAGAAPDAVDGVLAQTQTDTRDIGDQTTYATQVLAYEVDGMYHNAGTWAAVNQLAATGGLLALAGRYARGAATAEYVAIRGRPVVDALAVGDYLQCTIPSLPVGNVRIGDGGGLSRVMQVVRITEQPATRDLLVEDAGPTNNPFTTVPTLSISTGTVSGQVTAFVTITNAAALNTAAAAIGMQIAFTSGATPAAAAWDFIWAVLPLAGIPTGAIAFALEPRGSTVWFRARATTGSELPSSYSTAVSATLAVLAPVTSLAAVAVAGNAAALDVSWVRATTDGAVFDVEARTGSDTFTPRATLPAGSLSGALGNLAASTLYDVRVRARVVATGQVSAWASTAGTTASAALTVSAPSQVRAGGLGDGRYTVAGIVTGNPAPRMEAESAIETAVASGAYGAYVPIGIGEPDAAGSCAVTALAPNDGLRRRVRVRASNAFGSSAYVVATPDTTPWISQPILPIAGPGSFEVRVVDISVSGADVLVRVRIYRPDGTQVTGALTGAEADFFVRSAPSTGGAVTETTLTWTWDAGNTWHTTTHTRVALASLGGTVRVAEVPAISAVRTEVPVPLPTWTTTPRITALTLFRDVSPFPISINSLTAENLPSGGTYTAIFTRLGTNFTVTGVVNGSVLIASGASALDPLSGVLYMIDADGNTVAQRPLPITILT